MDATDPELLAEITQDEGTRLKPYVDTVGKVSIGIGRNLTDNGIRPSECAFMLKNDVAQAIADLSIIFPEWQRHPSNVQRILVNLCFNLGRTRFAGFHQFLSLIRAGKYDAAANDLKTTAWFGQVGQRGPRMIARLTAHIPVANAILKIP